MGAGLKRVAAAAGGIIVTDGTTTVEYSATGKAKAKAIQREELVEGAQFKLIKNGVIHTIGRIKLAGQPYGSGLLETYSTYEMVAPGKSFGSPQTLYGVRRYFERL